MDDPDATASTVWSPFARDTSYFDPSTAPFMINYRVADISKLLEALRAVGVQVDDRIKEFEYGRFGWVMDPEDTASSYGNRRKVFDIT